MRDSTAFGLFSASAIGIWVIGILLNLVFFWAIFCCVVMLAKPFAGGCNEQWGVDNLVVLENAFCPVDKK